MARLRLEYKSEPEKGEPFIKAEGYIEVMYNSELEEMKAKIQIILQESNEKIASLSLQCSQLDIELENSYAQIKMNKITRQYHEYKEDY